MPKYTSADLIGLAPTLVLFVGAMLLLLFEVFQETKKRGYQAWFTAVVATVAALSALPILGMDTHPILVVDGVSFAVADRYGAVMAMIIAAGVAMAALTAGAFLGARNPQRAELYALTMSAAGGTVLLSQATDLLMIFVVIAIMVMSTYELPAYHRRGVRASGAAFKYFIRGAFSTALYICGVALVCGAIGGQTGLVRVAAAASVRALLLMAG